MENKFGGTGVAIITPFSDGEIDYLALRIVVDHVISGGVDFIVALGSTGEAATISPSESRLVLDAIINETKGRVPLVAGNFGSNNTRALVNQINRYSFDGIDAILSASPSYSKPSQQGIYEHYTVVADASPVPVILYNVPSRTSSNISADTTIRLSKHSNIIGIKEASGDLAQAKDIIRLSAEKFFVTSGDDVLAPAMTLSGGVGVISVLANAYPAEFSQMISHFVNGQSEQGKILEDKLYSFHDCMYSEGNPSGIKTAMEILGVCSADVRLPLTRVSSDLHRKLVELVKNL
ncbi:MAG TPA: 4-hydroxy-tetrahydrodipicolinate synthase [Saprospirales bacterium]|jgi:4-hydroxy-tetrahydrodipicolinate synthase|nr:4-hydroxy-tetrahydrodipicolinate synthase [Saprospiraceae bacterium]MDC1284151.1 4-hydroxy-tetrahydrodipicolinate synthase [Saprospiraceae bacterium]HAV29178.1 4-hydroxy-tetrahydrodipicolinate synthase [Saprospirales bacterium]HAW05480.1 4-hydroxy-tetrahydrodipicolinate synthase [Saprospirales bacterium]